MAIETTSWIGLAIPAFVGATVALIAGVPLEHYKRHRDRQGAAAVLAAEIGAQIRVTEQNKTVETFTTFHTKLKAGNNISLPSGLHTAAPEFGIIFDKQIDKLGLLPPDVAARVVEFYVYLVGVRASLRNLLGGNFDDRADAAQMKAAFVETGLAAWDRAANIAATLMPELNSLARQPWLRWRPFKTW